MGGENFHLNTQAGLLADVHMDDAQCHIDVLSPTGVFTDADLNEVAGLRRDSEQDAVPEHLQLPRISKLPLSCLPVPKK